MGLGSLAEWTEEPGRLEPRAEGRGWTPGSEAVVRQGCSGWALLPVCTHRRQGPVSAKSRRTSPRKQLEEMSRWNRVERDSGRKRSLNGSRENVVRARPERHSAGRPPRKQQSWTDTREKSIAGLPGR